MFILTSSQLFAWTSSSIFWQNTKINLEASLLFLCTAVHATISFRSHCPSFAFSFNLLASPTAEIDICRKMRESEKRELINELPCTEMVKSGTNELASGSNPSDSTKKDIQFLEISKIFSFESFYSLEINPLFVSVLSWSIVKI